MLPSIFEISYASFTINTSLPSEILAETDHDCVLVLDRSRRRSSFATDLPAVQQIISEIGSAQNLALTRLWTGRRLVLVEGKDMPFLRRFHELLFPNAEVPLDALPNMPIGGWSGWPYAIGGSMVLTNAVGETIITYCILDSDYHTRGQIRARQDEAHDRSVQLHIWSKKEIENFLVRDALIHRVIVHKTPAELDPPTLDDVRCEVDAACEALRNDTTDNIAHEFLNDDRRAGLQAANRGARQLVEAAWQTRGGRINLVSGKDVLSRMSSWAQRNYRASFGTAALLAALRAEDLDQEIRDIVGAIERTLQF